jgi:L-fuculose-phosphate aldolase
MNETELREQICLVGQLMHRNEYIDGASGNISARLDNNAILMTPSGLAKGFMRPEQLIIVNMNGERVDTPNTANEHLRPTSEMAMHLECYQQRPDIQGVVHAHPPAAIALTISGHTFSECLLPEVVILLGIIPILPYASPASQENQQLIRDAVAQHDAMMLTYHGSLTVAKTLWDAYLRLENLEHSAKIIYTVNQLGGAKTHLSTAQIGSLLAIRQRLGLLRSHEREQMLQLAVD